ncbi:TraB/GumN family protein [Treponema phagedenis]|uniref:TraB/GumN family protein n=1 Tax=Treponema phagedenis TaxID=162 RepID=UPI0004679EC3|nr:TraB/GumN family protein [Treponema phagedenis]NVP23568.1 TraB/GumN family protein [Treponema phagedenis]QEJ94552.1 TraB/GumN family protein [Treponema phagedenis]QEK01571.1 TraB/GumN family protein [Treponema phagedenis]QEK06657.1 TraB/GumN family protein [Treponema phagedenis]QKS91865.1 TraB/GumN family protein [Treponema phagedenis]
MSQTIKRIQLKDKEIILLGTAHISKESITEVQNLLKEEKPDCVCVELDQDRYKSLTDEKKWQELDITKVLKEGKGFLLLTNLILASFQKKMGAELGVKPGDEMKAAIKTAEEINASVELVDRPIHLTLKRAWGKNGFFGKAKLLATLLASAFSDEKLTEEEIEALKEKSAMDSMMNEVAEYMPTIKEVLIDERDRYLASKIWETKSKKIIAVLGAGHLPGTETYLHRLDSGEMTADVSDISVIPPKTLSRKIAGWIIPALIIVLLLLGFWRGGIGASAAMLTRWFLWNGSLTALGTLIALGHPLSIIIGFITAPIATLSPVLGVGLFTGLTQAWLRKPQVVDMETLTDNVAHIRGWYKNKIAHVLLIFFLSSLGGAIGNFIAVPALFANLVK